MLSLAACGGGGNKGGGGNTAPTANAGADQTVDELTNVSLTGSGNDANGNTLTYSWTQTAGATVTLNNGAMAQANFDAPDVAPDAPETLTFQLTVSDGTVDTTDSVDILVREPAAMVTVSGTIRYQFVPPNLNCSGLDMNNPVPRSIRGATVQLMDAGSMTEIARTVSDDAGGYSFANILANTMVYVQVRAELKRLGQGLPSWDVEVRDNVDTSGTPPLLGSRPLYALTGIAFNTGTADVTENLLAATGWDDDVTVNSYTGIRAAAPFSVLDTIYSAMQFILSVEPAAIFPPLDAFWSVNNTATIDGDIDLGELGTSFYQPDIDSLFLVGDATDDTEEFDDHVIVHEWGHYFEDNFSRSDSIGGSHGVGDRLDPRLAFGEGWATALAGMALGNHLYCDTGVPGTSDGFGIGAESGSYDARGWYDEISVIRFIYDMWDDNDDGGGSDTVAIGFAPIYAVMTDSQSTTKAFTTIFSFATELRALLNSGDQMGLDAQLARENMSAAGLDIWGTNELNDAGDAFDVLPIYTDIVPNGIPVRICSISKFDRSVDDDGNRDRFGNQLSEHRFLRMDVTTQSRYMIEIDTVNPPSTPPAGYDCNDVLLSDPELHQHSDPDVKIFGEGFSALPFPEGLSCVPNQEVATTSMLDTGTYVLDISEFRYADLDSPQDYPDQTCFDVTITQSP